MQSKQIYQATTEYFLSPVKELLDDADVSEILINGPDTIYCEKGGKLELTQCRFESAELLMAAATNIAEFVNRRIGGDEHSMDARLPDGSRVHIIVPPSSRVGTCISIRKFKKSSFNLDQLVKWKSISEEAAEFLDICVKLHKNMVIAGGTGTGKTSLLNALSACIPGNERIVVIEDSSELQLNQPHTVYLEAQPPRPDGKGQVTIRDLFVDSLRMRPDRIVVGEIRRGEALDLIQSMISGHSGALTTVHATTAYDAAVRLETLSMMSDVSIPQNVSRLQVASAIDLVIQITRYPDGSRKISGINECLGTNKNNEYEFQKIFEFKPCGFDENGRLQGDMVWNSIQPTFAKDVVELGLESEVQLTRKVFQAPN